MMRFDEVKKLIGTRITTDEENIAEAYDLAGAVEITGARDGYLSGIVGSGHRTYSTKITWFNSGYTAVCNCNRSGICEHIWATLITAEEDGYFEDIDEGASSGLNPIEVMLGDGKSVFVSNRGAAKSVQQKAPPIPRWKEVLKQISAGGSVEVQKS